MLSRTAVALVAALALGGCNDFLDTSPSDQLPDDKAVTTPAGARAALAGAYNALQSGSYYGGDFILYSDLYSDNAIHTGTFSNYADAGQHQLRADNSDLALMWNAIYDGVKRANILLQKVPNIATLDPVERDQILGEAYFLRALHYHNLVKLFGGVPLRLIPITKPEEAAQISRSTVPEVYTQILSDLGQAEALMTGGGGNHASAAAAKALLARVYLYQADYANALLKANEVVAQGFTLAPTFSDLYDPQGQSTPEDIFKITFTAEQFTNIGYYYLSFDAGGRYELAPSQDLIDSYDTLSTDARLLWGITPDPVDGFTAGLAYGSKWPTPVGAEDFPAIRFGEVLLIKAEAFARQAQLDSAVATYNLIRVRAGLAPHTLGVEVTTQPEVLAAIDHERRLELAMEGDRFPDLVRTGQAVTLMGIQPFQQLYPIPQAEVDVAPLIAQNPGY
jgi:hypothetical protein